MEHAWVLKHGADGTMTPFDYTPDIDPVLIARIVHEAASEEEIASIPPSQTMKLLASFELCRVPVAFGYLTRFMHVSPAIKEYIETLEPGVHRFFPVKVESTVPINGAVDHGIYYILMPPPVVDCVIIEHTRFAKGFGLAGWQNGMGGTRGGGLPMDKKGPCVLRRQSVIGRHLWRTKVGKFYYTMASDTLWDAIGREPQSWGASIKCSISRKYDTQLN